MVICINDLFGRWFFSLANKRDWSALYDAFVLACESEPKLSITEFAKRNDLPAASARRSFNDIKKARNGDQVKSDRSVKKGDQKPAKTTRSAKKAQTTKKVKPSKTTANDGEGVEKAHPSISEQDFESEILKASDLLRPIKRVQVPNSGSRGLGFAGVTHGAYMDFAKFDPDIIELASVLFSEGGATQVQSARLIQMSVIQNKMKAAIEKDYAEGNPWKDENGNTIPISRAKSQLEFGSSKAFTDVEKANIQARLEYYKLEIQQRKLEIELHVQHPLSYKERIARTRELLAIKAKEDLSAVDASYLFEVEGIPIPRTLAAEADKEISLRQPERIDAPEVTAEELDEMMAEYSEQMDEWDGDWLAERQQGISELKGIDANDDVEVIE